MYGLPVKAIILLIILNLSCSSEDHNGDSKTSEKAAANQVPSENNSVGLNVFDEVFAKLKIDKNADPKSVTAQFAAAINSDQKFATVVRNFDQNKNGIIDGSETDKLLPIVEHNLALFKN